MGFAGNLSTLSLVEVLQTINRIRATGVLRLASAEAGRDVIFNEGEIIGVAFRAGEERLALLRRLILLGKIDAQTAATISSSGKSSTSVIQAMVQRQQVSQADVEEAVIRQSEDELYNLCTWEYADFVFHDATPEDTESNQLIAQFKTHPLKLSVNSLLMEAARRLDEWGRLRDVIPSEEVVPGTADGKEVQLAEIGKEYPYSAVVPLIDAVRTIEDIVHDSVATRLEVYGVLVDLLNQHLLLWLSRDDMIAHANFLSENQDHIRAAQLFRRALAMDPADHTTRERLAECLEQLGSTPEAAGCFSQLALALLEEQNRDGAISAALRAVSLAEDDPRQRLILVRCLLEQGEKDEAINELRTLVKRYLTLGQLEDARGTCLKILEVDPSNEDARREMARIFATAERDPGSEDVVVCIQCSHVNHREATACAECKAPLRLECTSCGRTVAVSDRICIFCGANPHAGSERRKRMRGSPATSRLINPEKVQESVAEARGTRSWKQKLEDGIKKAKELEAAGNVASALTQWREVALINQNNTELQAHIRVLEARMNDLFTEQTIESGHRLRRSRHFWGALKAYKAALRAMGPTDPRAPRLHEIVHSTARLHRNVAAIYAMAILLIGVCSWLMARPYLALHAFSTELVRIEALIKGSEEAPLERAFAQFEPIESGLAQLDVNQARLSHSQPALLARADLTALHASYQSLRTHLATRALNAASSALDANDLAEGDHQLATFQSAFTPSSANPRWLKLKQRLQELTVSSAGLNQQIKDSPGKLAEAQAAEKASDFGTALALYHALSLLPHSEVSAAATTAVTRLEPRWHEYQAKLEQAQKLVASDLARASAAVDALEPAAHLWHDEQQVKLRKSITTQMDEASAAFSKLGLTPSAPALERFLSAYPASPQVIQARARLDHLQQMEHSRAESIAAYQAALAGKHYEQAWKLARGLLASADPPAEVKLPVLVDSEPAGAEVMLDAVKVGTCPCVVLLPDKEVGGAITIGLRGWVAQHKPVSELTSAWNWKAVLARQAVWQVDLGKPVTMCSVLPEGMLVLAGKTLARIDAAGHVQWHASVAGDDDLLDVDHYHFAHQPVQMASGGFLFGLPSTGVTQIDANGTTVQQYQTQAAVHGRPALYTNDILGGHQRMAFAGDALYVGEVGGEMTPLALPSAALAGPLVLSKDLDRTLIVATIQGRLLAFEESTRKKLWDFDLKATEIGQLVPAKGDLAVAVVDGSRLVCYHLGSDAATIRWTQPLQGAAIGDPVVSNGVVYQSAGSTVIRVSLSGDVLTALTLPAPACTAVAVAGELVVIGCSNGQLLVYRSGTLLWSSLCSTKPSCVGCTPDKVVVGLDSGMFSGYNP